MVQEQKRPRVTLALPSARAVGLALLALTLAGVPWWLTNPFHYEVATLVCLNATVCVALNLLIGYAGQISLGHAGFFALGAYGTALLAERAGLPTLAGLGLAVLGVAGLALLVARPILRLSGHYLAMGTLGLGMIVSIVLTQEVALTGGPDGLSVPGLGLLGWTLADPLAWYGVVAGLLLLSVWGTLNLIASPIGRALRSLHSSEIAAAMAGVNTRHYKVMLFVYSAAVAALCGGLFGCYGGFITPAEASFSHSIELVTMVVLGGLGSTFGAVIGAALLTVLPQVLAGFQDYEMVALGGILMATMIFLPRGLVPSLSQLARHLISLLARGARR